MNNIEVLHRESAGSALRIQTDSAADTHWCFMHAAQAFADPAYRPCFSPRLLKELRLFAQRTIEQVGRRADATPGHLGHVVLASDAHVFNLGGDLGLFAEAIRRRDREHLTRYARECVDAVHLLASRIHPNLHTVALVEGDALGGGLELALACQTIVAETGVQMGFPEVLFGLFPGMGAYTLLSRRVSPKLAEEMMLNGVMYSSDELHAMGIVDVLVGKGEGVRAVEDLVRRNRRIATARLALHRVRETVAPVRHDELMRIVEVWVDTALQLGDRSLRMMDRLIRAQLRRPDAVSPGLDERAALGTF
ncbi:crotonase/enoyl-CoA hydratase family protein [Coralloluteibacterium thermophilus]|uniref:Crotonase/enoyl-CoA hydratase family protein n=1 Tax=Coralloluteibacterium thermophilum TaxID=2707049 RepID=A0ABV9NJJ3_9GAMM